KVREVSQTPEITKSPNMPFGVEGVISLRGNIIPIISLGKFIGAPGAAGRQYDSMIVTEFNKSTQAFLVDSVDRIIRIDWEKMRAPDAMMTSGQAMITAVSELEDGKLVSILDVEQILASVVGEPRMADIPRATMTPEGFAFFVDDSLVARKEITQVFDKMGVKYHQATNGREAWNKLQAFASRPWQNGETLHDTLKLILVDAEMPEMDGYVLTRHIKSDKRFDGIPVVMHSSLSSNANRTMGAAVGVDAYVAKFEPTLLAETMLPFLQQ
ncbi:chemotaxis protein, partial [Laribacter hongkongensis]